MSHYLRTVPEGCACHCYPVRDPAEPQLGTWLDMEPNPSCWVHFPRPWRIRRVTEGALVVGWVIEQYLGESLGHAIVHYYEGGADAIAAFANPRAEAV
ncbi:hypothetical protein SEA_LEMOND_65 [Mycobacterium phage LeMond]|nr:hypothetical protein SEA_LEMOND_65 [Mycobacterium phage LeMond]AYR01232.1 hypothetical protein SEA_OSCAR_65 [Mycobacterium phage Oscar]